MTKVLDAQYSWILSYEYQVKYFHTAVKLVMLPARVGYVMPQKGTAMLVSCGGDVTVLLVPLASCFHKTFRKVASLRVLNCLNLTRNPRATVEGDEWMQAQIDSSITSQTCFLQRAGKSIPSLGRGLQQLDPFCEILWSCLSAV